MKKRFLTCLNILFIFVLVLSMTLALASCGKEKGPDKPGGDVPGGTIDEPGNDTPGGEDNPGENPGGENPGDDQEPEDNFITISELLNQTKTNVDVKTEGVVFATLGDGVFVSDGTNSIFVKTNTTLAIGDKVTLEGAYRLSASQPIIAASTVTKTSENQSALAPVVDATISSIANLTSDKTNFAKFFSIHGVLTKTESGRYVLSFDDASLTLTSSSVLETYLGTDITLTVITTGYDSTKGWTVTCVDEAGIVSTPFDLIGSADTIFSLVTLPETVINKLTLPSEMEDYQAVTFTWSVIEGNSIVIEDNEATVSVVSEEEIITLKLTLTAGTQTKEKNFTVKVVAPKTVALSELGTVTLGEEEAIFVSGTVVAFASNQGASIFSAILYQDGAYTRVDLDTTVLATLSIGSQIQVLGVFSPADNESYSVESIKAISCVVTGTNDITLASLPFVELRSEEDYNTLLTTPYTKVTLYKITNPYFSRSTSSDTNFFRIGATVNQSKKGLDSNQYVAFFVNSTDSVNKNLEYLTNARVKLDENTNAVLFDGYTIYAFGVFRGKTTMQLAIPSEDAIHVTKEAVDQSIVSSFTKTTFDASSEGGSFTLPCLDFVTWAASSQDLILENGVASYSKFSGEDKTVTLTGSYSYYGENTTVTVTITLTGAPLPTLTATDVANLQEKTFVPKFEGVVVGLVPSHGGSVATYPSFGVYVSDGKNVVIVDKGLFTVSGYSVKLGETPIEIGDKLYLTSVEYDPSMFALKLVKEDDTVLSTIEVTDKGIDTTSYKYDGEDSLLVTITNASQLSTIDFSKISKTGKIIKIVATEENPIYIAAQNAYLLALDFLTDANKQETAGTQYVRNGYAFTMNVLPFAEIFGSEFTLANTPVKALGEGTYGSQADIQSSVHYPSARYSYTGTLYLVCEYATTSGTTKYIFNGVLAGSSLTITQEAENTRIQMGLDDVKAQIQKNFERKTFDASNAGSFDLPKDATWTCASELITIVDGVASFSKVVGESQTVTFVGTYSFEGNEQTILVEVTLQGGEVPIPTISDLASLTEDEVLNKLECVVVGILPSHGGTIATYSSFGLLVSDGTNIAALKADGSALKVAGYTYTLGDTTIAVGDKLSLTNVKYTVAKKTLEASSDYTIEVVESGIDTSAYTYTGAVTTTITSSEELLSLAKDKQTQNYGVIQIVADADHPIYLASDNAYLLALDYLTAAKADSTDGTSFLQGEYKETINVLSFASVFGNDWTIANTPVTAIGSGTYGSSSSIQKNVNYPSSTYAYTGTLYLVYEYTTSSKQVFNAVLAGSTLTPVTTAN